MSYRRKLKIDCTAKMSNPSVKKLEIQKQHITNIKKEAVIIFFFTMWEEKVLEHVTTGKIYGQRQQENILDSLSSWHGQMLQSEMIHSVRDHNMWKKPDSPC